MHIDREQRSAGRARDARAIAVVSLFALLSWAGPVAAKVVEFTSSLKVGYGDGGNPPTTSSQRPNGVPGCSKGVVTHLNASVPGAGFVEVEDGAAPQSIMAFRPFRYGTPGPLGPGPTFSMPGAPGVNGGPEVFSSTCMVAFAEGSFSQIQETRSTRGAWPAQYSFHTGTVNTMLGGTAMRIVVGTGLESHHLNAGGGPGDFSVVVDAGATQRLTGMKGPNRFGGGFRATGQRRVRMNMDNGFGSLDVYWLSGPRISGHNASPPTQVVTQSGTATTTFGAVIPLVAKAWFLPFTTGMVHVEDHGGQFVTIRGVTGADDRTPMGEMGTLLLVSPWTANVSPLGIHFGGTAMLQFNFLPEPDATALLAAGVVGVLALHCASRRRR